MGNVSFEHQGRRIEGMRMQNLGDAYMVNGWEAMPYDNHSGIVYIYRNPKGDASILAYYNQDSAFSYLLYVFPDAQKRHSPLHELKNQEYQSRWQAL